MLAVSSPAPALWAVTAPPSVYNPIFCVRAFDSIWIQLGIFSYSYIVYTVCGDLSVTIPSLFGYERFSENEPCDLWPGALLQILMFTLRREPSAVTLTSFLFNRSDTRLQSTQHSAALQSVSAEWADKNSSSAFKSVKHETRVSSHRRYSEN